MMGAFFSSLPRSSDPFVSMEFNGISSSSCLFAAKLPDRGLGDLLQETLPPSLCTATLKHQSWTINPVSQRVITSPYAISYNLSSSRLNRQVLWHKLFHPIPFKRHNVNENFSLYKNKSIKAHQKHITSSYIFICLPGITLTDMHGLHKTLQNCKLFTIKVKKSILIFG